MRVLRGSVRFGLTWLGALGIAGSAHAQLLVAATPGESAIEHAELAYALGDGPPITWLSLRVERGPVAVVAALPEAATASAALDAWFAALENTASPNVLAPRAAPSCGRGPNLVRVAWPRARSAPATQLALDSQADVQAALDADGLTLESPLPEARSFVVWSWPASQVAHTTRTLRVEGGAAPLALLPGFDFPVSLSVLTNGPMRYDGEVDKSALEVTFAGGEQASTDYRKRLSDFVKGPWPLLETRARGLLFDWSIYGDVLSVAPLVRSYPHQASSELQDLDVDGCSQQLRGLRSSAGGPVSACGDAVDASLALTSTDPELATLQRLVLSSRDGVAPDQLQGGGEPSTPLLRAQHFDDAACETEPLPPITRDPQPRPVGGSAVSDGSQQGVTEEVIIVEHQPVEVSCGSSPEPEPVDSYDYYENDDEADCSSDTSGSSDSTGDEVDCAGDSSTASSQSDDAEDCSSDSSTSSDDGCSGDSSTTETSGYDGDTCTGNAVPQRDRPPPQAGRKPPRRLKTSLWSVAFVALVLPIRRRKRGLAKSSWGRGPSPTRPVSLGRTDRDRRE